MAGSNPRLLNKASRSLAECLRSLWLRLRACPASGAGASAGGASAGGMLTGGRLKTISTTVRDIIFTLLSTFQLRVVKGWLVKQFFTVAATVFEWHCSLYAPLRCHVMKCPLRYNLFAQRIEICKHQRTFCI